MLFISYKEIRLRLKFFGNNVENITLCSHNSIKCMSYHLNRAQTMKGRPRMEICLLRKAKPTSVITPTRDRRVTRNDYSTESHSTMNVGGPHHSPPPPGSQVTADPRV